MESKRQLKVAKLVQKDLGEIFQQEMRHLTHGAMVTVTKVNITPDLQSARVYLSVFASKDKEGLLKNIKRHASGLRGKLGNRIRHQMKSVPELHFHEDD